ncbi:14569_t:CDS:2 [Ambispora leptoticha]|uniref:14569_t:CDS:1 n=1 Tax=Ambispora leptoticha TaxID=144679 RepID=A0A9N9FHX7_9GLOM|nr:14569_t:CDS:2 [Ambispora leptoticha]
MTNSTNNASRFSPYRSMLPRKKEAETICEKSEILEETKTIKDIKPHFIFEKNRTTTFPEEISEIPEYERATDIVIGSLGESNQLDADSNTSKDSDNFINNGKKCFNCGSTYHKFQMCPLPKDIETIGINREKYEEENPSDNISNNTQFTRYYLEIKKRSLIENFVPGTISDTLKDALGILDSGEEPPYYCNMRIFGYPPGYLGYEAGQDPLRALKNLRKYNDAWDASSMKFYGVDEEIKMAIAFDKSQIDNESSSQDLLSSDKNDDQSDKEEGELDEENDDDRNKFLSSCQSSKRIKNVPLVNYPGLDLKAYSPITTYTDSRYSNNSSKIDTASINYWNFLLHLKSLSQMNTLFDGYSMIHYCNTEPLPPGIEPSFVSSEQNRNLAKLPLPSFKNVEISSKNETSQLHSHDEGKDQNNNVESGEDSDMDLSN